MIEYPVHSFDDLLSRINEFKSHNNNRIQRIWYRGQADKEWPLIPSIQREPLKISLEAEPYIINDFYIKSKQVLQNSPSREDYSSWLTLMQHYGLPTRLLDWSISPLIAAFFAIESYKNNKYIDADACIWVLLPRELNKQEGFGDYVYSNDAYPVQKMLACAFQDDFCPYETDKRFDDKIIAFYSSKNDFRMYSQQSAFTVHNSFKKLEDICSVNTLCKLIIPNKRREYFLSSLASFGIDESFVYPDIEHIAEHLKKRYAKKPLLYEEIL